MNDGQNSCEVTTDGRRGFEVLMRKLLKYPRGPAVVVLHWWSPVTQVCCGVDAVLDMIPSRSPVLKSALGRILWQKSSEPISANLTRVRTMSASRSYFAAATAKYSCG